MFFSDSANLQKFTNQVIGILAAVAIPAFDGFRKKARSGEAKTNLGALYTAERAYFYEDDKYSDVLATIGFEKPSGTRHYAIGFTGKVGDNYFGAGTTAKGTVTATPATSTVGTTMAAANCKAGTSTFKACATGTTNTSGDWSIEQNKVLAECSSRGC